MNIAAATGDMGILANHVPSVEPLRPGVVEVIESGNASKKWFGEWMYQHRILISELTLYVQSVADLPTSILTTH